MNNIETFAREKGYSGNLENLMQNSIFQRNYQKWAKENVPQTYRVSLEDDVSAMGYKDNSPYKNAEELKINSPSGRITMKGVSQPIHATSNLGEEVVMQPNKEYQFQGTEITEKPIMQNGGQRPPIYVSDQNDKRLQMYNDSSLLFTLSNTQMLKGTNNKENLLLNKSGSDVLTSEEREWYRKTKEQLKNKSYPNSYVNVLVQGSRDSDNPNSLENDYNNDEYFHPDIKPIGGYNWSSEKGFKRLVESNDNFLYKKPVQPIIYKPTAPTTSAPIAVHPPKIPPIPTQRPKEELLTIEKREYTPIEQERKIITNPYENQGTFRRPRQQQESGREQIEDYFDKTTGKYVGSFDVKNNKIAPQRMQNGGAYSNEEYEMYEIPSLNEVVIEREGSELLKLRREYEAKNNIDQYIENRIKNPKGREAIKLIDEKGYREELRNEYFKNRDDEVAKELMSLTKGHRNNLEGRLGRYNSYTDREREVIQNSKYANQFLPAERAYRENQSNEAQKLPFNEQISAKGIAQAVTGTGERGRLFPNAKNNIEDWVNPAIWIGDMASNLGNAPKDIEEGNYGKAAMSVLSPLAMGAVGGIGAKTTGQFTNNLVNPFAGTGQVIDNLGNKYLPNAYKLNPNAFKPNPNNFYRQVDTPTFNEGLESGLIRGKQDIGYSDEFAMKMFGDDAYYNKGRLYYKNEKDYPYLFEANLPEDRFIPKVNGRTRKYTTENTRVRVSKEPLPINDPNITTYKKDWLKGYKEVPKPKSNFKSEINWSKWNKEIPENASLMKEYNAIEQQAKANGTWMKNPDGTPFKGTSPTQKDLIDNGVIGISPEEALKFQFLEQQTKDFKKAFPDGFTPTYKGGEKINPNFINKTQFTAGFTGNKNLAGIYGKDISTLASKNSKNSIEFDAQLDVWSDLKFNRDRKKDALFNIQTHKKELEKLKDLNIPISRPPIIKLKPKTIDGVKKDIYKDDYGEFSSPFGEPLPSNRGTLIQEKQWNIRNLERRLSEIKEDSTDPLFLKMKSDFKDKKNISTDNIATYIEKNKLDNVKINNVEDGGRGDVIIGNHVEGNYFKSLIGNNGKWDMTNPNIYKSIILAAIGVQQINKHINNTKEFQNGGLFPLSLEK